MKKIQHIVFDHDGTLVDTAQTKSLYPGIANLLDELCRKGVKLYVWTARTRFSTVEFLKSLGIISRFEQLSCSTDCEPKPSPEGLLEMLGDVNPEEVLVIGDSSSDMIGAKGYGARSIGALWGVAEQARKSQGRNLLDAGANFTVNSTEECKIKIFELL